MATKSIKADYSKSFLFPPALEDWVPADHPARFVREVVEALDLEALGFEGGGEQWGGRGRPHYSGRLLLKAWLYGYMSRIRSQRQLERACRENVGLIWLLGMEQPDHNTLWRFWKRHRKAIGRVFAQVVRIALKTEVVGLALHALDGTKIQAGASSRKSAVWHRRNLREALSGLDEAVERIEAEIAGRGTGGEGECRLPEELADRRRLRERVRGALRELDEAQANHLNPVEPDARLMPCEGARKLAYNAQAVVDGDSGLIVAGEVVNEAVDCRRLGPMLEEAEANLGGTAGDTVADKGYRTDENIGEAEAKGRSVLVQLYRTEGEDAAPFHASRFEYDKERDCVVCPLGEDLVHEGRRRSRHGWEERRYRCRRGTQCPVADQCHANPRGRTIHIGPHHEAVRRQRERQRRPAEKEKLRLRKTIVEPVFAHIKGNEGFRRWSFRGLEAVQAQWAMLCTAYNLKKLLRLWASGQWRPVAA